MPVLSADSPTREAPPRPGGGRSVLRTLYPELRFSRISRADSRLLYYSLVADLLSPDHVVLDFGAGRGIQIESAKGYLHSLMNFQGRCRRVIGIDPDPAVLENPHLDEAHVIGPDGRLPLPDASVDLVSAYAVLEHISRPEQVAEEIFRVLKPGGWFCAWTPNKWGYVGIGVQLVPNNLHARLIRSAAPRDQRKTHDVFPTCYRLNTLGAIRKYFDRQRFDDFSFVANGSPSYHFDSLFVARFWMLLMALSPPPLRKTLYVFTKKR